MSRKSESENTLGISSVNHMDSLWQKLLKMRRNNQLCDTYIVTNAGTTVCAHSVILAANSDLLMDQITLVQNGPELMQKITIEADIDEDALTVTVDYMYGLLPVSHEDVRSLQKGAQLFGLTHGSEFCEKQLKEMNSTKEKSPCVKLSCPFKNPSFVSKLLKGELVNTGDFNLDETVFHEEVSADCSSTKSDLLITTTQDKNRDIPRVCPFAGTQEYQAHTNEPNIADVMGKFIGEVLTRHLARHNRKTRELSLNISKNRSLFTQTQTLKSTAASEMGGVDICGDVNIHEDGNEDYKLPAELSTGLGSSVEMPMDINHCLLPEMTVSDLGGISACPHWKRIADQSGLCYNDTEINISNLRNSDLESPSKSQTNPQVEYAVVTTGNVHSLQMHDCQHNRKCRSSLICEDSHKIIALEELPKSGSCKEQRKAKNKVSNLKHSLPPDEMYGASTDVRSKDKEIKQRDEGMKQRDEEMKQRDEEIKQRYELETNIGSHRVSCCRKPHQCPDCGLTLPNSSQLVRHSLREHNKGRLFNCTECSFKSPQKKAVQAHMLSKHQKVAPGLRVFSCDICSYNCMDKHRFKEHQATHSDCTNYKCHLCEKSFKNRANLHKHLLYHRDNRPHVCDQCDARFKVRDKLQDHIRLLHTHPGVKPFKCAYCDHTSALRGNCNQHIHKTHPHQPVKVIDLRQDQRSGARKYDYSEIQGTEIKDCRDLST